MAPPPELDGPEVLDYGERQKRYRANFILGNYQLLIRYARMNGKSIPQTKYYFEQVRAGFPAEPVIHNWFDEDK